MLERERESAALVERNREGKGRATSSSETARGIKRNTTLLSNGFIAVT